MNVEGLPLGRLRLARRVGRRCERKAACPLLILAAVLLAAAIAARSCATGVRRRRRSRSAAPRCCSWSACCRGATRGTRRATSRRRSSCSPSLLVLGEGCERAGVFDALAARLAAGARGSGPRLLTLVIGAAAAVTAVLGLDATVVLLTPAAFAAAAKARLQRPPARVRVRAPGQLGLAAAADLEPHEPARVPRQRALVRALRGADGAAVGGGDRDRVGRAALGLPARPRGARPHAARRAIPPLARGSARRARVHARGLRRRRARSGSTPRGRPRRARC